MIHRITTQIELDVMQGTELIDATELAFIHKMPAIVVHPDLVTDAVIRRGIRQGQYKIIVPVDWPKGDKSGVFKMQGIHVDALSQDGYEILISNEPSRFKIKDEIKSLSDFIHDHLPQATEFRIVLDTLTREPEVWEIACEAIKEIPAPTLIRNDHNLKIQQSKANIQIHQETIKTIYKHTRRPIKVSGNINSVRMLANCQADRYAVNLRQAQNIIAELRKDPNKIRELFKQPVASE